MPTNNVTVEQWGVPGAIGETNVAALYLPDSTNIAGVWLLADPQGIGEFGGNAMLNLADGSPFTVEVRSATAVTTAAFLASTNIRRFRGPYYESGGPMLSSGAWVMPTASSGSGFSGPSSVTLTFVDANNNPVPNVLFTITPGQGALQANTSGISAFGLANGNYTVIAQPTNFVMFANSAITVSGATTQTIYGSTIQIPVATNAGQVIGGMISYDGTGSIEASVTFEFQYLSGPSAAAGVSFSMQPFTAVSGNGGTNIGMLFVPFEQASSYRGRRLGTDPNDLSPEELREIPWSAPFTTPTNAIGFSIPPLPGR